MVLKYQKYIDNLSLTISCPDGLSALTEETAVYRFCHDPIDLMIDFLPNVIYDKLVGITYDYSAANKDEVRKCSRCGASFHKKIDGLIGTWNNMSPQNQQDLGYKAISSGRLGTNDGLVRESKSGHIGFYEFEEASFHGSFKIVKPLE